MATTRKQLSTNSNTAHRNATKRQLIKDKKRSIAADSPKSGTITTIARDQSNFGVSERLAKHRAKASDIDLDEIYVDPSLLDLIVVDPITKRPLGRPSLTLLINRATGAIAGTRISFESPSSSAIKRAITDAISEAAN
jgi:hypothetical protein